MILLASQPFFYFPTVKDGIIPEKHQKARFFIRPVPEVKESESAPEEGTGNKVLSLLQSLIPGV